MELKVARADWRRALHGLLARIFRRYRILPGLLDSALDIPDKLSANAALVVRKGDVDQWLVFDCPCRKGHRVMLNLDKRDSPVWTIQDAAPLSLVPSVDETSVHGRCHYVIKKGRIRWV